MMCICYIRTLYKQMTIFIKIMICYMSKGNTRIIMQQTFLLAPVSIHAVSTELLLNEIQTWNKCDSLRQDLWLALGLQKYAWMQNRVWMMTHNRWIPKEHTEIRLLSKMPETTLQLLRIVIRAVYVKCLL